MHDTIEFRGSYQYATPAMLEAALASARVHLDSATELDVDWMRCFSREDTVLHVHATLPASADDFFASGVLRALAQTAMQGAVESRRGGLAEDFYFVESIRYVEP